MPRPPKTPPKRPTQTPAEALDQARAVLLPAAPKPPLAAPTKNFAFTKADARRHSAKIMSDAPDPDLLGVDPSAPRRRIGSKHIAFVRAFASQNFSDPNRAAKSAGFTRVGVGYKLADHLADLIEKARQEVGARREMEPEEAEKLIAELARDAGQDPKIRLAAARTILEIHGSLNKGAKAPPKSRDAAVEAMQAIVGRLERGEKAKLTVNTRVLELEGGEEA